jgi:glycerate 2-kinase
MEMSAASGLAMVSDITLNPLTASTRGTGEMMRHAIDQGAKRILIGIGGSATNDGGTGMAAALGCRFLDGQDAVVRDLPAELERVQRIETPGKLGCEVIVACDVSNPLLGEHGCSAVYGPQKGVRDVAFFDARLRRLAAMVVRDLGIDYREEAGAGAAGGLGFGLMSFCNAKLQSGFDLVAEITELGGRIENADLVITGEGRLDGQTLHGKGPIGVAAMARLLGKRVVGVGGMVEDNEALRASFDALFAVKPPDMPIPEAIARAAELLEETVARQADSLTALVRNSPRN